MRKKFQWVFDILEEKLQSFEAEEEETQSDKDKAKIKELYILQREFINYCDKLPVIGFNSQRYDLPLIKRYLPSSLERLDSLPDFVIRKNNSYMTLRSKNLLYLDLTNYLAAGTSLSAFYKAYNVTDPKGFFCYEWFDSLEKLEHEKLPPRK